MKVRVQFECDVPATSRVAALTYVSESLLKTTLEPVRNLSVEDAGGDGDA